VTDVEKNIPSIT